MKGLLLGQWTFAILHLFFPVSICFVFLKNSIPLFVLRCKNSKQVIRNSPVGLSPHTSDNKVSASSNITAKHVNKYRSLNNNSDSSFMKFVDSEKLGYLVEDEPMTVSSISQRVFLPEDFALDVSPMSSWVWWEKRRRAEKDLKQAITSSNVRNIVSKDISGYFDEYKKFLTSDYADILQANHDFYRSIAEGDISLMSSIWHQSRDAMCIMNGQDNVVVGYEEIVALWSMHMPTVQNFDLQNVKLLYQGDLAVVTFILNSSLKHASTAGKSSGGGKKASTTSSAYVTNIFIRPPETDRYLLTAHIATNFLPHDSKYMTNLRETYQDPFRDTKPANKKSDGFGGFVQIFNSQRAEESGGGEDDGEEYDEDDSDVEYIVEDGADGDSDNGKRLMMIKSEETGDDSSSAVEFSDDDEGAKQRLKEKVRQMMAKAIGQALAKTVGSNGNMPNIEGGKVFIIGKDDLSSNSKIASKLNDFLRGEGEDRSGRTARSLQKKSSGSSIDASDEDEGDEDDDDDEEEEDEDDDDDDSDGDDMLSGSRLSRWRKLASLTVSALKWLSDQGRLSSEEKAAITSTIVENTANGEPSKAVFAYAFLIERLAQWDAKIGDGNHRWTEDLNEVDDDDVEDFAQFCHRYAIVGESN